MNWCLSASQTEEYLKKADEIKIYMNNHKDIDIIAFKEINPKARILIWPAYDITLFTEDYEKLKQYYILCKENMAFLVLDDKQAKTCKDFGIPFFFAYPARTFAQLNRMYNFGATDVYIDDMLAHCLDSIKMYYPNIKIRVIANSCGWGMTEGIQDGIEGSWYRPEDLWKIKEIDSAEFFVSLKTSDGTPFDKRRQEQALYRIYAEDHKWNGYVHDIVFDIQQKGIVNAVLDNDFQEYRNNCHMKCMETHRCHFCHTYCDLAKKNNIDKIKENINNG